MRVLGPTVIATLAAACFSDGGYQGSSGGSAATDATTTTTTGTGTAPTSTETDPTVTPGCEPRRVSLVIPPPKVMLLLDKSGSMSTVLWDHDADPNTPETSHWPVLHAAVSALSPAIDGSVELGLTLFPIKNATPGNIESLCTVGANADVPTAPMNLAGVLAALPGADATLSGGTPTNLGLMASIAHLGTFSAETPRSVLLVTDGAANCKIGAEGIDDGELLDTDVLATVASALASGIRTFVVGLAIPPGLTPMNELDGIPDSVDTQATLHEIAAAGGTLAAHDAQTQVALEAALHEILTKRLIPCEGLAAPLLAGESVAGVSLSPSESALPQTDPCGEAAGWRFSDDSHETVTLCGTTCAGLQASRVVYFDVACASR